MIDSIDKYRFINQESLDSIELNGEIMPFRDGYCDGVLDANGNKVERKNMLRGEDVAFIMEAAYEKLGWWDWYEYCRSFDSDNNPIYYRWENQSKSNPVDFKKNLNQSQIRNAMYYYRWDFFNKYSNSFNLQAPLGFKEMPPDRIVYGDVATDYYYASRVLRNVMFDAGKMLIDSDYKSRDMERAGSSWNYLLSRAYIEGMIENISNVKTAMFQYDVIYPPTVNVHEEGTWIGYKNPCWWAGVDGFGMSITGCNRTRVLRIKVNGKNSDVISSASLYAYGQALYMPNVSGTLPRTRKGVMMKVCDGVCVNEDGDTYIDFYMTVTRAMIDKLYEDCGFPAIGSWREGTTWYEVDFDYSVFFKFSNRTTFSLV